MHRRKFLSSLALSGMFPFVRKSYGLTTLAPAPPRTAGPDEAGVREVSVRGGKYRVWTKQVGSGTTKVLLLHGGPGMSHEYLECFESFLPQAGIEFYYYDQLGCNNSDKPKDPSLWNLAGYLQEVEEVRSALGLDDFVLYGHSWGAILAIEYALKYPQHLKALVLSNMAAGMKAYVARIGWWKKQLPHTIQRQLDGFDRRNDHESDAYSKLIMDEVYPRMICRSKPWPEAVTRTLEHANEQIYIKMQGRNEFQMTGNLKEWERWADLPTIKTKTLTIGSRYDEMDPHDMQQMAQLIPNAKYGYCPNGSHLCMWDDQAIYFQHLLGFLKAL